MSLLKDFYNGGHVSQIISDLWRSHPVFPSTFGPCSNEECETKANARGSFLCSTCIEKCLAELLDDPVKAREFHNKIKEVKDLESHIYDLAAKKK